MKGPRGRRSPGTYEISTTGGGGERVQRQREREREYRLGTITDIKRPLKIK